MSLDIMIVTGNTLMDNSGAKSATIVYCYDVYNLYSQSLLITVAQHMM